MIVRGLRQPWLNTTPIHPCRDAAGFPSVRINWPKAPGHKFFPPVKKPMGRGVITTGPKVVGGVEHEQMAGSGPAGPC